MEVWNSNSAKHSIKAAILYSHPYHGSSMMGRANTSLEVLMVTSGFKSIIKSVKAVYLAVLVAISCIYGWFNNFGVVPASPAQLPGVADITL